jgi:hypothetical protein
MTPAADPAVSTTVTAGWLVLLVVTIAVGIVMPPAGAAVAAVAAVFAHQRSNRAMRTAFIATAVVFGVLTLFVGAFLVSIDGGETVTGG